MSEASSRRRRFERVRAHDAGHNVSTDKHSEEHTARPKDVTVTLKAKGQQERGRGKAGERGEEEKKRRGRVSPEDVQEERKDGGEEGERRDVGGGGMKVEARDRSRGGEGEKGEMRRRHSEEERKRRGGGMQDTGRTAGGVEGNEDGLRWRVHQLEKDKLELISLHNQETSSLQSQLAKLRCEVERGEAVRQTLEYQLTVEKRQAAKLSDLTQHTDALTARCAELQQTVCDLQTALEVTRQSRQQDQHALQQEVEERDRLLFSVNTENDKLHTLLQEQEEVMEGLKRRLEEVEREKERDSEVLRRQTNELKYLMEREEKSRKELELSGQKVQTLQSNVEAERSAHLETKFNSEIIQLRIRDLEAAVSVERCGHQEALSGLEMLRSQFIELERAGSLDRDAHHKLQKEYEQCRCELSVAVETERKRSSELMDRLEEEERQHTHCLSLLQQAGKTQSCIEETYMNCINQIQHTLQQHNIATTHNTEAADRQDTHTHTDAILLLLKNTLSYYQHTLDSTNAQLQELLCASERLEQDNQTHRHINSQQLKCIEESDLLLANMREEVTHLRQESSDSSALTHRLRVAVESAQLTLETERQSREEERRKESEQRERESEQREGESEQREGESQQREGEREQREREREEVEREREECKAELQHVTEVFQKESKERVSFLYSLYQRLVAGCVLLDPSQCMLGNFSCTELCDVIVEQVNTLTSDLSRANDTVVQLQSVCDSKSVCVRELQRSQQCVLSRLEESVRHREQAWDTHRKEMDQQHTHTVTQLHNKAQLYHSQVESLRLRVSSVERERSSATSDLARLRGLLARSRGARATLLSACTLLAGALAHTYRRAGALSAQRALFYRLLEEREGVETEVRRLVEALGGEEKETGGETGTGGEQRSGSRGLRRWRKGVCAVLAANRLLALARSSSVALRVERRGGGGEDGGMRRGEDEGGRRGGEEEEHGGRQAVCVCICGQTAAKRELTPTTDKEDDDDDGKEEGGGEGFVRWLRSKHFNSVILSSMTQLQEVQTHNDSTPPEVMSAAREGLSQLLEHLLGQSDVVSVPAPYRGNQCPLVVRLGRGLARLTAPPPNRKTLVSSLQQHFLLFSQRLHSAEVERRSLRLELATLKRASKGTGNRGNHRHKDPCDVVPVERFQSVCAELRQALNREQEAQALLKEQSTQLRTLTVQLNTHTADTTDTQHTLSQAAQEVRRKEQSLRILGKRLSAAQREKRELEDSLRQMEDSLTNTHRSKKSLVNFMTTVENTYKEVRDSLVQSRCSVTGKPLPLHLPRVHVELSGTERMMGGVEVTACERLVSTFADLYQAAGSRIGRLEQEVSAHRSHVTALRGELQDACLRDNLAYVPVAEFSPLLDLNASHPTSPLSDLSRELPISRSPAQPCPNPTPLM